MKQFDLILPCSTSTDLILIIFLLFLKIIFFFNLFNFNVAGYSFE